MKFSFNGKLSVTDSPVLTASKLSGLRLPSRTFAILTLMNHKVYFKEAAKVAEKSLCLRDKCGAVVVLDSKIIGEGYNGPACDNLEDLKCNLDLTASSKPKSDRTCCLHSEWRAIIDAVRNAWDIRESTLCFARVDDDGNILRSGLPYCTVCSRLALDNGVKHFALLHDTGVKLYDTQEYNDLSYKFHLQ